MPNASEKHINWLQTASKLAWIEMEAAYGRARTAHGAIEFGRPNTEAQLMEMETTRTAFESALKVYERSMARYLKELRLSKEFQGISAA